MGDQRLRQGPGGVLERCTRPEEAVQFHDALLENGVKSELVIYPEEGHGVRKLPAARDGRVGTSGFFVLHRGDDAQLGGPASAQTKSGRQRQLVS